MGDEVVSWSLPAATSWSHARLLNVGIKFINTVLTALTTTNNKLMSLRIVHYGVHHDSVN
jgi:hypothetical protein